MPIDAKRPNGDAIDWTGIDAVPLQPGSYQWRAAIALAVAAPAYAATTWQVDYTGLVGRNYAFPVLLIEIYIVALAGAAGFRPIEAFSRLRSLTRSALAVWLLVMMAGTVMAAQPGTATAHAAVTVLHGLFALALWDRFSSTWHGQQTALLTALACGAAMHAALVHVLAFSVHDDPGFNWNQFGPGVSNVRQLGFYGLGLVGIGVGLLASVNSSHQRWLHCALLLTGYYMVDWSGGRAAFGAAIGASAVVIALAPREARRRTASIALGAFILAMPLSLLFVPNGGWGIQSILTRSAASDLPTYLSGRLELWTQTAEAILDHPLLGHGMGQFRSQLPSAQNFFNHPHNSVLQFLYQWGALGTAALAVAMWGLLRGHAERLRTFPAIALPATGTLAGMTLMSLLEGNFFHVYPLMVSMVCLAALGSALESSPDPKSGTDVLQGTDGTISGDGVPGHRPG